MESRTHAFLLRVLLREAGFRHEDIADRIAVSKEAVDSWCSGRARVPFNKLASLIRTLGDEAVPPERLRELLLEAVIGWGMDREVVEAYLGPQSRVETRDMFTVVAWDLRSDAQQVAVGTLHRTLSELGRELAVLDCRSSPALRRYYLHTLVPVVRPGSLILFNDQHGWAELDSYARRLATLGIATVYVQERPLALAKNAAWVGWDDWSLGFAAGQAAAETKSRVIGAILYEGATRLLRRQDGFQKALSQSANGLRQIRVITKLRVGDPFSYKEHSADIAALLQEHRPDLIFVPSAVALPSVVHACMANGRTRKTPIPIIAIAAKSPLVSWLEQLAGPSLKLIPLPAEEAGRLAARLTIKLEGDREVPLSQRTREIPLGR